MDLNIETTLEFESDRNESVAVGVCGSDDIRIDIKDGDTDIGALSLSFETLQTIMQHVKKHRAAVGAFAAAEEQGSEP